MISINVKYNSVIYTSISTYNWQIINDRKIFGPTLKNAVYIYMYVNISLESSIENISFY